MADEKRKSLLIVRFPYHGQESPDVGDWLFKTILYAKRHPQIDPERIFTISLDDTPVTMTRNQACDLAKQLKVDYLLMIDNDIKADHECRGNKLFFPSSLAFMLKRPDEVSIIAAPYCGPPPDCLCYVFRWASGVNYGSQPNPSWKLDMIPREEASMWRGITEVAALPTGLILIDTRALDHLGQPYFDYEWEDERQVKKATTEDVYFTRNASLLGIKCYCNWDCWAGHHKRFLVERPKMIHVNDIREEFVKAVKLGYRSDQALERVVVKNGQIVRERDEEEADGVANAPELSAPEPVASAG